MRVFIAFVIAAVALGYVAKSTILPTSTVASLLTVSAPTATTMSPHGTASSRFEERQLACAVRSALSRSA
jgi:hypothetical protein